LLPFAGSLLVLSFCEKRLWKTWTIAPAALLSERIHALLKPPPTHWIGGGRFHAKGHIDPVFFCERIEKEEEAKVLPKDVIHTYWRCIRDFEQDCVRLAPAQEGSKGGFAVTTNYDMSGDFEEGKGA